MEMVKTMLNNSEYNVYAKHINHRVTKAHVEKAFEIWNTVSHKQGKKFLLNTKQEGATY